MSDRSGRVGRNLRLADDVAPVVDAPGIAVLATKRAEVVGCRIDRPTEGGAERAMAVRRPLARRPDDLAQIIDGSRRLIPRSLDGPPGPAKVPRSSVSGSMVRFGAVRNARSEPSAMTESPATWPRALMSLPIVESKPSCERPQRWPRLSGPVRPVRWAGVRKAIQSASRKGTQSMS